MYVCPAWVSALLIGPSCLYPFWRRKPVGRRQQAARLPAWKVAERES